MYTNKQTAKRINKIPKTYNLKNWGHNNKGQLGQTPA